MYPLLDAVWERRVAQLLTLAARPFQRFRIFEKSEGEDLFVYLYDSMDADEFSGRLSLRDGEAIGVIVGKIISHLLTPALPELTAEQYRFFDQLRKASLEFERRTARLAEASNRELFHLLWEKNTKPLCRKNKKNRVFVQQLCTVQLPPEQQIHNIIVRQ